MKVRFFHDGKVIDIGDKNTKTLFKWFDIVQLGIIPGIFLVLYTIDYLCGWCIS